MKKLFLIFFVLPLLLSSCTNDDGITPPPPATAKGIYIINEGGFGQNNASLSFYNIESGTVTHDVFALANGGEPLGDVANSMFIEGKWAYIAVDNSNKIEIIDAQTFVRKTFIDFGQGSSPREMWVKDSTTGYVTSLYGNKVFKFNPSTSTVLGSIDVGDKPEGIVEASGKLFVANSGFGLANTISVINLANDMVESTISVGYNPVKVLKSSDGFVYVISAGSYTDTTVFSGIYKIDPSTNSVLDSIGVKGNPNEACMMGNSNLLIVNSAGVFNVDLTTGNVPLTPLINGTAVNSFFGVVYSVSFDATTQKIYCGNPKDFTQNGDVAVFDINGNELSRFEAGLLPGTLYIK